MAERRMIGLLGTLAASLCVLASVGLAAGVLRHDRTIADQGLSQSSAGLQFERAEEQTLVGESGALAVAQRAGDVLFGLLASPGGPVEVRALAGRGDLSSSKFRATMGGDSIRWSSCGRSCFRLNMPVLTGSAVQLNLELTRRARLPALVTFRLPARLPESGRAVLRRLEAFMGSLSTVRVDETLTNGLDVTIRTRYVLSAPDRIRFETSRGQRTILIGKRRWDWERGRWVESPFPGAEAPVYAWQGASRARLLGRATVRGQPVKILAVLLPDETFPAWFRLFVTNGGRVLKASMLAPSHFMTQRFSSFDEPVEIEPPRS
jgi:hypothetical protein